jgi:hypothetical protein
MEHTRRRAVRNPERYAGQIDLVINWHLEWERVAQDGLPWENQGNT